MPPSRTTRFAQRTELRRAGARPGPRCSGNTVGYWSDRGETHQGAERGSLRRPLKAPGPRWCPLRPTPHGNPGVLPELRARSLPCSRTVFWEVTASCRPQRCLACQPLHTAPAPESTPFRHLASDPMPTHQVQFPLLCLCSTQTGSLSSCHPKGPHHCAQHLTCQTHLHPWERLSSPVKGTPHWEWGGTA